MNNTERGRRGGGRGDGRNSLDLGGCCTLYRVILDPNFFAQLHQKVFPPFQICLDKVSFKEQKYSLLFSIATWFQMTMRVNRAKKGQK